MLKEWLPPCTLEANDDLTLEEHRQAFRGRLRAGGLNLHLREGHLRPARGGWPLKKTRTAKPA